MLVSARRAALLLALLVGLSALAAACGAGDDDSGGTLTVFAAASLNSAFTEIGAAFEAENEGVAVEFNFAGSQALATQLIEGADADIFASANLAQMERVVEEGLADGDAATFARNQLAIIVPADNPAGLRSAVDLGSSDLKLVLAAEDVPAGAYAREVLERVEEMPAFREVHPDFSGFNVVSNETNVSQVVTRVSLGEADAGIVYATDVTPDVAEDVLLIEIPAELNVVADYPVAALEAGDGELARAFIAFVLAPEGQAILADWGFAPGDAE